MSDWDLPDCAQRGTIVLLSGWRRVGKTSLLLAIRDAALRAGLSVGGFLSVARFADGEKTGIDLMDAATGRMQPLAVTGSEGAVATGHFTFDPGALEAGWSMAKAGCAADVFFVDELGPLELLRGMGWADVISLLQERQYRVAFVVVRPELIGRARRLLELPQESPCIMVDAANRDGLAREVSAWLLKTLTRPASETDRPLDLD